MEAPRIITALAEEVANRLLRLDPDTRERLGRLDGKVVGVEVAGIEQRIYLYPFEGGVRVAGECPAEPDVVVRGTPGGFLGLGLSRGGPEAFARGAVELHGDAELAQDIKTILAGLDPDWEEWASGYMGDVAAHQLGRFVRGAGQWGREALQTLGQDAADYLTEERPVLAGHARLDDFLDDVDTLRADVDRLEQRVRRLLASVS